MIMASSQTLSVLCPPPLAGCQLQFHPMPPPPPSFKQLVQRLGPKLTGFPGPWLWMTFDLACQSSPGPTCPLLLEGSYNPLCSRPTPGHTDPPESLALQAIAMASRNRPRAAWIPVPLLQVPADALHSCLGGVPGRHRLALLCMHVHVHTHTHIL